MTEPDDAFKPKIARSRGQARRAAIIRAASEVFFEKGFEAASLSDILTRAGGSKTLIYEQFGDKEGLFEEVMSLRAAEILEPLEHGSVTGAEPETVLRNLGRTFLKVLMSDDCIGLARIVMSEGFKFPGIVRIFFERGPDLAYERLRQYLERMIDAGAFVIDDPALAAKAFYSMLMLDTKDRLIAGHPEKASTADIARQIDFAVRTFMASYGTPAKLLETRSEV